MNNQNNQNNHSRKDDDRIDEIVSLVKEIHQRQTERTIPAIERMEHTVYGNGKKGLCESVSNLETNQRTLAWVLGFSLTFLALAIAFLEFVLKLSRRI